MSSNINIIPEHAADHEIVISRVLDAPRKRIWEAMLDPDQVVHRWGPNGFTTTIESMGVRSGGVWKHVMHGSDGTDYPNCSVFKEVNKPKHLVYSRGGGKKAGPGVHFLGSWTFDALGFRTRLMLPMILDSSSDRELIVNEFGAIDGGHQCLDCLAHFLASA